MALTEIEKIVAKGDIHEKVLTYEVNTNRQWIIYFFYGEYFLGGCLP